VAAPEFRVADIELYERDVTLRMPFRFGAATLTSCPQAFVRVRIEFAAGRAAHGAAAELMVPKWFDKSPRRSNADNIDDLRDALRRAAAAYAADATPRTAFGHFAAYYQALMSAAAAQGGNPLVANYGPALLDRAVLDALCRSCCVSFAAAVRANIPGIDTTLTPDLDGPGLDRFLAGLRPRADIAARHTVGMLDPVTSRDAFQRVADGLPQTLEEVIARYGNHHFKLKLSGDRAADISRLVHIASVLDRLPAYAVTLDGNEQYADAAELGRFLGNFRATPALARMFAATLYVEQPLPRVMALQQDLPVEARIRPLLIDESDATLDAFPAARARGYEGVSTKSCKGVYKALLNAARCAQWNAREGGERFFVSGEDLTMQAGLAVQQDLALATLLGLRHVERNGHHYVDGFRGSGAGPAEQQRFATAHPALYTCDERGVRLRIAGGSIAVASLDAPGFASAGEPAWDALAPLAARSDSLLLSRITT
jgi:hypothetical protein